MAFKQVTVIRYFGPVALFRPWSSVRLMVGENRGGENDGCEGENDGLVFMAFLRGGGAVKRVTKPPVADVKTEVALLEVERTVLEVSDLG